MCANYLPSTRDKIARDFGIVAPEGLPISETWPGGMAPILRLAGYGTLSRPGFSSDSLELVSAMFGMVPYWAEEKLARHTYNSRSETSAIKPAFRDAWKRRQFCIIPAEAIFEPSYETGVAQRWEIRDRSDRSMGIAGIWEYKDNGPHGKPLLSFSMLTVNADGDPLMRRFHKPEDEKRSVVILQPHQYEAWLHSTVEQAPEFLDLFPSEALVSCPAGRAPATSGPGSARKKPETVELRSNESGDLFSGM